MKYIQFWHKPVERFSDSPVEACGDRSVIIVDGRWSIDRITELAKVECQKRKYYGFSIHQGESFTRSRVIKAFQVLQPMKGIRE